MNLSDRLFSALVSQGAEVAFFVAGGNAMYLNEGMRKSGLKCVPMHHEQAAAMAAEAYSRISDSIGLCVATNGPAVSNLATGLAGAFLDSVPMVAIVGQSKDFLAPGERSTFLRQKGLFELDNFALLSPVAKGFISLSLDSNPEAVVQTAISLAREGRPGPVVIEVNLAVQSHSDLAETQSSQDLMPPQSGGLVDELGKWSTFIESVGRAKKPLILAGNGVLASRSQSQLREIAQKFKIPFVTTQLAKGVAPFNNELFVGHVGPRGDRAGNHAIQNADLLIAIGSSLGTQTIGYEATLFGRLSTKFVQDLGSGVSSKNLELGNVTYLNQGVPEFLTSLEAALEQVEIDSMSDWRASLESMKLDAAVINEMHRRSQDAYNLYDFVHTLSIALAAVEEPTRVVTDAGLSFYIMGQAFRLSDNQTYTVSGGLGSMGYALPAGIGQTQVEGASLTVVVTGDGSMQMNVQELASISALKSRMVIFVVNNEGYASIRNTQDSFFGSRVGSSSETGVEMPDWELVAKAYRLSFERLSPESRLEESLGRLLSGPFPILVEVVCQPDQVVMPYVPNYVDESGRLRSKPLDEMAPAIGVNQNSKILN